MTIDVQHKSATYDLSVVVDGLCNHAATEIEKEVFNSMDARGHDTTFVDAIEVCVRCKCWRPMGESNWNGIGMMPMT